MSNYPYTSMRDRLDLSAYFVVGPQDTKGRPVTDVVAAALRGGATFIQLRAKNADAQEITSLARDIARTIADNGMSDTVPFLIDDRVDVVWQCRDKGIKVDGVHIGQTDMEPREARRLLGDDAIVGLSAETETLVRLADELPDGCIDYIGAGPLHQTATKPEASVGGNDGSGRTLDARQIDALCAASDVPVVVGGGVHLDDIAMLAGTKAAGWFVVSAIAAADDPQATTRAMVEAWKAVRGDAEHGYAPTHDTITATTLPPVLTVAGSDSSGGAGIQADLKTMLANGVFGMSAITALTAQNTMGVTAVQNTDSDVLAAQIDAVFADIPPLAVKIGMVSSAELIGVIADRLTAHQATNIVLDPVMVATSGAKLIDDDAIAALTGRLFPLATVITPNIPETEVLLDLIGHDSATLEPGKWSEHADATLRITDKPAMEDAARRIGEHYGCAVLVKGGHGVADADDLLFDHGTAVWINGERVDNPNTHGTGCTLSSAIASNLAKGDALEEAIRHAKVYLTGALNAQLDLGHGSGPMDHAWRWR